MVEVSPECRSSLPLETRRVLFAKDERSTLLFAEDKEQGHQFDNEVENKLTFSER
jgi:hypothetical protein